MPVQGPNLTGLAGTNDFVAYFSCYVPAGNTPTGGIWTDDFGVTIGGSPSDFGKFLVAETGKWAKVIHDADLKLME